MRLAIWGGVFVVACGGLSARAMAQAETLEDVSLEAPEAEPGWKVVEFDDGYARWKEDAADAGQSTGGVQVVPAPAPESEPSRESQSETKPEAADATGQQAASADEARKSACETQKRVLAVRLLYLRGIEATPESAPLLLEQARTPLRAQAWGNVEGLGPGVGSELLTTAYATDLVTRGLVDSLSRCLVEAGH